MARRSRRSTVTGTAKGTANDSVGSAQLAEVAKAQGKAAARAAKAQSKAVAAQAEAATKAAKAAGKQTRKTADADSKHRRKESAAERKAFANDLAVPQLDADC